MNINKSIIVFADLRLAPVGHAIHLPHLLLQLLLLSVYRLYLHLQESLRLTFFISRSEEGSLKVIDLIHDQWQSGLILDQLRTMKTIEFRIYQLRITPPLQKIFPVTF